MIHTFLSPLPQASRNKHSFMCQAEALLRKLPGCRRGWDKAHVTALCLTEDSLNCLWSWKGHHVEETPERGWELRQKKGEGLQDRMSPTSRGFAHIVTGCMATLKGCKLEGPRRDTLGQQNVMGKELPN